MAVGDSLNWLPGGWTMDVKLHNGRRIKTYIEPVTNKKFYSKPEVLRYLEHGNSKSKTKDTEDDDLEEQQQFEDDYSQCNENEKPVWLPRGWTMVLTPPKSGLQSSEKQEFIMDPITGWKFFASPSAMSYLSARCDYHSKSEPERMEDGLKTGMSSKPESSENGETMMENNCSPEMENRNKNVYIVRKKPNGLPPGWIKEIKVTSNSKGVRRDPYYTDPASGYVFRSKKDALRYLETEDIHQCVLMPKKRDEIKWLTEETHVVDDEDIDSTMPKDFPNQGTTEENTFTPQQNDIFLDKDSREKIVVAQKTPKNLPPGWIKEVKIQMKPNGVIRKDPYYTDPSSGYVFRSEKDALRFLESGNIRSCSIKPKKRDELEWLKETTPQPLPATEQTIPKKRRLFPELPSRSSKRLSALRSKHEGTHPVFTEEESQDPMNNSEEEVDAEDAEDVEDVEDEDSLQNHQGSMKSEDDYEYEYEYESNPVKDVCSDPCIDFAYKTLTSSTSMENNNKQASTSKTGPTIHPPKGRKPRLP